jgi:hypothetical protein
MKLNLFSLIALLCLSFLLSCKQGPSYNKVDYSHEDLLATYQQELTGIYGDNIPKIKAGFAAEGRVAISYTERRDKLMHIIEFEGYTYEKDPKHAQFEIYVTEKLDLPESVGKAKIVYLGNQLILEDMESDLLINFFSESYLHPQNKAPEINTVLTPGIGVRMEN